MEYVAFFDSLEQEFQFSVISTSEALAFFNAA